MSLKERLTKFATTPGGVIPASPGFMPDDARKVLALVAALVPFAEFSRRRDSYPGWASSPPEETIAVSDGFGGAHITIGSLRDAQAALTAMEAE